MCENPVVWRSIHYFRQEKITIPGESRVFPIRSFLRRLKISSAVHDEIILEEILFNLLISSVICIFRVEVDDIFRKRWCEWCNNCYLYPINKAGSF